MQTREEKDARILLQLIFLLYMDYAGYDLFSCCTEGNRLMLLKMARLMIGAKADPLPACDFSLCKNSVSLPLYNVQIKRSVHLIVDLL